MNAKMTSKFVDREATFVVDGVEKGTTNVTFTPSARTCCVDASDAFGRYTGSQPVMFVMRTAKGEFTFRVDEATMEANEYFDGEMTVYTCVTAGDCYDYKMTVFND